VKYALVSAAIATLIPLDHIDGLITQCLTLNRKTQLVAGGRIVPPRESKSNAINSDAIFPFPVHRTQLPNGLTIMSVEYDSPGIIAYYTVVRTGSRNEIEPGLSGFAHFFEHMMFRGTPRFSDEKYNEVLKRMGADSNAFTSDDWTCYHITASKDALETIIELESDRFQNLQYAEPAFQKEARAVLGEYNKSASSPFMLLEEKMLDTAYTRHTYKHTTIGFLQDIENMPKQYQYSLKFFERWYRPQNCIVLVVGDVDHDRLVALAQKYYGEWPAGKKPNIEIPAEPPQKKENKVDLKWKGRTLPYLTMGYHIPGFDPKSHDVAALDILAEAAFSETSAIYRKLVLEERKVEMISADSPFQRDPTLFTITARLTSTEHFDAVRDEIYRTLEESAQQPLPTERLDAIKSHMRYAFAMRLDSADAVARTLGTYLQLTADANSVNQMYETYDQVTAPEILQVARKYFSESNRTVITLRSEADAPANKGCADSNASSATESNATAADEGLVPCAAGLEQSQRQVDIRKDNGGASETILPTNSPLVSIRLVFNVGSGHDPAGKEGLTALTTRMLTDGGTQRFSYDEILDRLYPMAAEVGGHCDKDVTTFTADVHRDKLADFFDLFAEMFAAPRFDPDDFERLREEQLNYVSTILRSNDDESFGKWTLQTMLYPDHPYGHVDAGSVSSLKAITLADVKDWYKRNFAPLSAKIQIGVAGGASEEFIEQVRRTFRATPTPPPNVNRLPTAHMPQDLELTIVEKNCIATAISIGFPIDITRADDDFYALAVANSALGEHRTFNGRLMRNMRGKRGLNYGDYSYIENFIQAGGTTFPIPNIPRRQQYFSIWIRPVPHDKAVFALRQAVRELDMLVADGLSEEEFESTRDFLLSYSKLWVQTQSRRLGYDMDASFYGRASVVAELEKRLPKLTVQQVNAAIKKHLQARNLCVAMITANGAPIAEAVATGKPSPLQYDTEGTPEEILVEDRLIDRYPLKLNGNRLRVVHSDQMFE
jgi:zinc protease